MRNPNHERFLLAAWIPLLTLILTLSVACAPGKAGPLAPLADGAYTIVVLPDTQWYTLSPATILSDDPRAENLAGNMSHFDYPDQGPEIFRSMASWIVKNRDTENIVFVSHVGDVVERGRDESARKRWELAREIMDILHGEVPYAIAPGNHDLHPSTGDTRMFEAYFGAERYADMPWYGGAHGNNTSSYQLIDAGPDELLFLHLVCNPPDDVLEWADAVLARYPDRIAIVTTHMMLGPVEARGEGALGIMEWLKVHGDRGNTPREMWDKLLARHASVRLVLSGDQSGTQAWHTTKTGEHGNTVHLMVSDYKQDSKEGYLRLLRIDPAKETLEVATYSPTKDAHALGTRRVPNGNYHQFTLDW